MDTLRTEDIHNQLFDLVDEKYKIFHKNLCPGCDNILGIRMPKLRALAKEIVKNDWQSFLKNTSFTYAEETMLYGYVLSLLKRPLEDLLPYIHIYVQHIDSWAVCDSPVSSMKFIQKNREAFLPTVTHYLSSQKEYELRFAITVLLFHYMTNDYIDYILHTMDKICHEGYYVKMAVAWTISMCYVHFKEKTDTYLHNNHLDDFTYNKSLQKICESLRVTKEEKIYIRSLKRK